MKDVRQAVIMVGGKGTRLLPLTESTPKPALPVLDKPCLKYLIGSFVSAGITEIFLACGYKSDILQKEIGDGSDLGVKITYSDEETPLGTGGAMKQLESRLDPVFAAANGDAFIDIDVREQIEEHLRTGASITIALTQVKDPWNYGIARLQDDGRITEFKDKPKPEEVFSNYINAGVYVVNRSVLKDVPEHTFFDFSMDLVSIITNRGERVQGYRLKEGVWIDVGRPSDMIKANLVAAERFGSGFASGVSGDVHTEGPFYVGKDSAVSGTELYSSVILERCSISSSDIRESLIMAGCNLDGVTVTRSILGKGCIVGRGAVITDCVLRDGTVVPEGTLLERRVG